MCEKELVLRKSQGIRIPLPLGHGIEPIYNYPSNSQDPYESAKGHAHTYAYASSGESGVKELLLGGRLGIAKGRKEAKID